MSNSLHLPHRGDVRSTSRPGALAGLWRDLVRSWRQAFTPAHHQPIDDATLRDLGMSRSELASYAAEASGRVELTRVRVIAAPRLHASLPERGAFE